MGTDADTDFVASVTAMGYWDDDMDRLIKTGHVMRQLLDQGAPTTLKLELL